MDAYTMSHYLSMRCSYTARAHACNEFNTEVIIEIVNVITSSYSSRAMPSLAITR
jgi:hypothetical protein